MQLLTSEFILSAFNKSQYPTTGLPEVALAGRSNVGKSSLINKLLNRKKLARTSSTPGKTQSINFFLINNKFYFADVPGYGFARVPKSVKASWGKLMNDYMIEREQLRLLLQIVDLRHEPTADDCQMYNFAIHHNIPVIVIATKADKIARGQRERYLSIIRRKLGVDRVMLFSSQDGTGIKELWQAIGEYL